MKVSNWFDALIIDLEDNEEGDQVNEIETIQKEIKQEKDANELSVIQKMAQVIAAHEASKPPHPRT